VSILLLWWTLHDVSLSEVWQRIRGVRLLPFLAMLVLATAQFPLRTIRWRYLLRLEGEALPFTPLWHATAIGFMANNLLPARAGEFARAYAAHRLTAVRFSTAFASIAVERVLDGITLVALLTVAISAGGFAAGTAVGGITLGGVAQSAGIFFGGLLVLALVLVHWPAPALRFAHGVSHRVLPTHWADRLLQILEGMLSGLDTLRRPGQFAIVILWSFVVWLVSAASLGMGLVAFDIDAPWSAAVERGAAAPGTHCLRRGHPLVPRLLRTLRGHDPRLPRPLRRGTRARRVVRGGIPPGHVPADHAAGDVVALTCTSPPGRPETAPREQRRRDGGRCLTA
jgi:uncharacterized protein (TIRG00374 family)